MKVQRGVDPCPECGRTSQLWPRRSQPIMYRGPHGKKPYARLPKRISDRATGEVREVWGVHCAICQIEFECSEATAKWAQEQADLDRKTYNRFVEGSGRKIEDDDPRWCPKCTWRHLTFNTIGRDKNWKLVRLCNQCGYTDGKVERGVIKTLTRQGPEKKPGLIARLLGRHEAK